MTGSPVTLSAFTRARAPLLVALLAVFLLHVLSYLYFFVDDEGITFIFARHLLEGKGFVYNSLEGRVEGYSDFLQVLLAAVWLLIVRALGWAPVAAFFIGKAVSIASGVGAVVLVWKALSNDQSIRLPGLVAGMGFLVLAPPLATWSCSSLEMASVALLCAISRQPVRGVRSGGHSDRGGRLPAHAAAHRRVRVCFALLAPAWGFSSVERRRGLRAASWCRLFSQACCTTAGASGIRRCSAMPAGSEVALQVASRPQRRDAPATTPYALAFLRMYGLVPGIAGALLLMLVLGRKPRTWPLLASAGLLAGYATLVGDWMIGFRFFLPMLPVTAILVALAISSIPMRRLAWPVAVVACGWFGTVAVRAATTYDHLEYLDSWWVHPSLDPDRYFSRYARLYEDIRRLVPPGFCHRVQPGRIRALHARRRQHRAILASARASSRRCRPPMSCSRKLDATRR